MSSYYAKKAVDSISEVRIELACSIFAQLGLQNPPAAQALSFLPPAQANTSRMTADKNRVGGRKRADFGHLPVGSFIYGEGAAAKEALRGGKGRRRRRRATVPLWKEEDG